MTAMPNWFAFPNDVQTEQDIKEKLEFERVCLERAKLEYEQAETQEQRERAYLDVANAQFRVANLKDRLCL